MRHARRLSRQPGRAGYTLTEMLVVIAIIGLLAAALAPNLLGQMGRARTKAARLQMETIAAGLELHLTDVGRYPTAEEGLDGLLVAGDGALGWTGPYVRDRGVLNDPWGRPIRYSAGADALSFRISSLGADGAEGGRGADADLALPDDIPETLAAAPSGPDGAEATPVQ